jgi:hypothetical protein
VAFTARQQDKWFVSVDGQTGPSHDEVAQSSLVFSPDGAHLAYWAKINGKWTLLLDGVQRGQYDTSGPFAFNRDSGLFAFNHDGRRFAYEAKRANKWVVNLDEVEGKPYDAILPGTLLFSPDGGRLAYAVKDGKSQFVVVDGAEGARFDEVYASSLDLNSLSDLIETRSSLTFSQDGKHFAYVAKTKSGAVVVTDGRPSKAYKDVLGYSVTLGGDGRVAYAAKVGNRWTVVVDGQEGKLYDEILAYSESPIDYGLRAVRSSISFSPNSRRLAYAARLGKKWSVVTNGIEGKWYDAVEGGPFFSADSTRIAYIALSMTEGMRLYQTIKYGQAVPIKSLPFLTRATDEGRIRFGDRFVVVDDQEGAPYDFIASPLFFDSAHELHYVTLKGDGVYLVQDSRR